MKNIALFIPRLSHGGAERVVSRIANILGEDYNIIVIVFDDKNIGYEFNCPIISLNAPIGDMPMYKKIYYAISKCGKFRKVINDYNIDLCISFGDSTNVISLLSQATVKRMISLRGYARIRKNTNMINRYFYIPLLKRLYRKADTIMCVSEIMREDVIEIYKVEPNKVVTLYNPYDISEIDNLKNEEIDGELKERICGKKVIISVGTIRYPKGYWHLVRAFSKICKSFNDAVLLIVGSEHSSYQKKLEVLVQQYSIQERVIFCGFDPNPFKYMAKSSIYVLSSISEGFPNSLIEAMACSLPVVAADCKTGPREILAPNCIHEASKCIEYHEWGILVPALDAREEYTTAPLQMGEKYLANALSDLLLDEQMRNVYAGKSRRRAYDFGYALWKEKIEKIIVPLLYPKNEH